MQFIAWQLTNKLEQFINLGNVEEKIIEINKMKKIKIKDILKKQLLISKLLKQLKDIDITYVMMESIIFQNVIINMFNMVITSKAQQWT